MARTKTLAIMRTEALQLADMENSGFVDTSTGGEVDRYLNEGIAELYDLVFEAAGQEWFLKSGTIAVTAGTDVYTLPTDFFIMKGVDLDTAAGGVPVPIKPYLFEERHDNNVVGWASARGWNYDLVRYRMYGEADQTTGVYTGRIRFTPSPMGTHTITVWYVPHAPVLNSDTDVWDGFNGWEEYPIVFAAVRMLEKEESDASHLHFRLERLRKRIESLAGSRDQGSPETVVDATVNTWVW